MTFRSLSQAGVGIGKRFTERNKSVFKVTGLAGRKASSWVGSGHGHHFGRSQASYRPGPLGAGTQLFKLVETDLVVKELTRYGSSDAEHLGLYSVQDVMSDISAACSALPQANVAVDDSPSAPLTKTESRVAAPEKEESMSMWAEVLPVGENILAACGMGQGKAEAAQEMDEDDAKDLEEGDGIVQEKMAIKRTYQPSTLKRKRKHGFLYRAKTRLGKKILERRKEKGRSRLGI